VQHTASITAFEQLGASVAQLGNTSSRLFSALHAGGGEIGEGGGGEGAGEWGDGGDDGGAKGLLGGVCGDGG